MVQKKKSCKPHTKPREAGRTRGGEGLYLTKGIGDGGCGKSHDGKVEGEVILEGEGGWGLR